ncbi:MAG: TolC family protein [Treponema sp.]|nr:TolC family protein [Treponema sp.]
MIFIRTLLIVFSLLLFCNTSAGTDEFNSPLTFAQAADLAVAASVDLRSEHEGLNIRKNAWVLGFRSYLPRISLTAQENDRLQLIGADSFVKNFNVSMDQLLWDGGRLFMSRKLERMDLDLSESRLDRMADEISESALFFYRNILSARTIIAIRETALESLEYQLMILKKEVELGIALALDLAEAELTLAENRMEIISLESDLAEMEKQFADILDITELPELAEQIDIHRSTVLPPVQAAVSLAEENNPDLAEARFAVTRRQAEYKFSSRTWIPALRVNGSFGVTGQQYPLTRHTWSMGITVEFANPWLQNNLAFQSGWESPGDRTAVFQNSASPVPDPAASLGRRQAGLMLSLETERYELAFERMGRLTQRAVERCLLADRKRSLAVASIEMAARRYSIEEVRLELGHITRLELIQAYIVCMEREIMAVESTIALMDAERDLERLLDLKPGELAVFARAVSQNGDVL